MSVSIFLFQRDLRLFDNKALHAVLERSDLVLPIFIYDPNQVSGKNKYKSDCAVRFMQESLCDLEKQLRSYHSKLTYFYGDPRKVIRSILQSHVSGSGYKLEHIYMTRDYTPFSVTRMKQIQRVCTPFQVSVEWVEDILLHPVEHVLTGSGEVYQKFTPYWKKAKTNKVEKPTMKKKQMSKLGDMRSTLSITRNTFLLDHDKAVKTNKFFDPSVCRSRYIMGGRTHGLKQLRNVPKQLKAYNKTRNILHVPTSRLSAYLKFGCVSIREVYWVFQRISGNSHTDLTKQLYWRDFYYNLSHARPITLSDPKRKENRNLKPHYKKVGWITKQNATSLQKKAWRQWMDGETGFPIVDACMRELKQTGYMHNRGRLITASFLVKHLFWSWEEGERYFATSLIDYDPIVNNGNWQWVSGSGADSQPYFRILNPWLQGKRFDPNGDYIRKWVPELQSVPTRDIHKWYDTHTNHKKVPYPEPIVDHETRRDFALKRYERALR